MAVKTVIKEWKCNTGCGFFESAYPVCTRCGSEDVLRVFLTAPSIKGDKTKFVDSQVAQFTRQSGITDYSNNLSTHHEKESPNIWKSVPLSKPKTAKDSGVINFHSRIGEAGGVNFTGPLAGATNGGVNIADMKPSLGGKYESIVHKDDIKSAKAAP